MENLEPQIIDVSKIQIVPSDTEIPVHNNSIQTKRPLCSNFPENSVILDNTESIVKVITDISEDLENNQQECLNNVPQYIEELQAVFDPLNVEECTSDLFEEGTYTTIDSLEELKKFLSELLIRFDTNPKNYTKNDYSYLFGVLYKSLIFLYENHPLGVITTEWLNPHSDLKVPSEKLVAETIKELDGKLDQEVLDRIQAIADEAALRLQGDLNLLNTKQDKLIAGPGISIVDNVISNTNLSAEWGNIAGNLEDQEDLQEALDEKADIEDIPTNVSELNNDSGYLTQTDITGKEDKFNKVTSISSSSTNTLYPSAKCVYDEFTTTVTSDGVSSVDDITVYTNLNIQVINKTQDSSSTFTIDPNKMYMFGTRTSLTITLNPGESGIVNEYTFQFTSGATATTLNVPSSITWLKDPNILTDKKYLVSIENNLGIIGEWNNE